MIDTYYPGAASAPAGATSISVGSPSGAATAISSGDLLLVIEMQDEAIDSANSSAYGAGTTTGAGFLSGTAGIHEYVVAVGPVTAGSVPVKGAGAGGGLVNSYAVGAASNTQGQSDFQVVRVPQYSTATLGSALAAQPWNGATGGILALDVAGGLSLGSATVSVDGTGFRGGGGRMLSGGAGGSKEDFRSLSTSAFHGDKGEGAAGTPEWVYDQQAGSVVKTEQANDGYPNGSAAVGAPGNAGGGGADGHPVANDQNSGGGGGGNGGSGGMGGNSWNSNVAVGGMGGAAFPANATQVVLGGGGGSGTRNNSVAGSVESSGGAGGGMVLIRAGSITGTGTITANGTAGPPPENDGGGGGGAGGTVEVLAQSGELGGLTVVANGARGADAWPTGAGLEANRHGPGGGGAGGVVVTSSPPQSVTVAGGVHGTTTLNKYQYNAQNGTAGITVTATVTSPTGATTGSLCFAVLTATKSTGTPIVENTNGGTSAIYTIVITNGSELGRAQQVSVTDTLPTGFTYASTGSFVTTGGATRTTTVTPSFGDTQPTWGTVAMPGGSTVTISFTVIIASSVPPGTYSNLAVPSYLDPERVSPTEQISGPSTGPTAPVRVLPGSGTPASATVTLRKLLRVHRVAPGGRLAYRLIVRNVGTSAAETLRLCDRLPPQTTVVSLGKGSLSGGRICFSLRRLAVGKRHVFALVLRADSDASGRVVNRATVTGANFRPARARATAQVRTAGGSRSRTRGVTG